MAIPTTSTRPSRNQPETNHKGGLRLTGGTYHRRPWQVALGIILVVLCAGLAAVVFSSSAKRVSVVIAAKNLPAGTELVASDLSTGSIPASGKIVAMSATYSAILIGKQLNTPVFAGQLMVRQMVSSVPLLTPGNQVVGMELKGNQMPSVPLVPGDIVAVIAVPQTGQASTINPKGPGGIGSTLVPIATVFATAPASVNQTQYVASVSLEVPEADASTVASYAAADQIGLSLVSEGSR